MPIKLKSLHTVQQNLQTHSQSHSITLSSHNQSSFESKFGINMYHLTSCPSWKHYTFIKYANATTPSTWFVNLYTFETS